MQDLYGRMVKGSVKVYGVLDTGVQDAFSSGIWAGFAVWVGTFMGTRLGLDVNGSGLTWRGWVSWEGCFHQGAGEGRVSPVADLGRGREEGGERGIV